MNKCKICKKEISITSANHGLGMCRSCAQTKRMKIPENTPGFVHGNHCKEVYCLDCKKKINSICKRCWKCYCKFLKNPKNGVNYKNALVKCTDCGKELNSYRKKQRCRKCYTEYRLKNKKHYYCKCGKEIGKTTKRCIKCSGKYFSVEKSWNWLGGKVRFITRLRTNYKYIFWRKECLKRDNCKCQICNKRKNRLHVHHKIPLRSILILYAIKTYKQFLKCKLLWDVNWGITLCQKCHNSLGILK